jgi:hypothetical protein
MQALDQQRWQGKLTWAFDGASSLITPQPEPPTVAAGFHLPVAKDTQKEFAVQVPIPGKSVRQAAWKVCSSRQFAVCITLTGRMDLVEALVLRQSCRTYRIAGQHCMSSTAGDRV